MERQGRLYLAYVLRIWPTSTQRARDQPFIWRASLEDVRTGQRLGFSSLVELFTFLAEEVQSCEPDSQTQTRSTDLNLQPDKSSKGG